MDVITCTDLCGFEIDFGIPKDTKERLSNDIADIIAAKEGKPPPSLTSLLQKDVKEKGHPCEKGCGKKNTGACTGTSCGGGSAIPVKVTYEGPYNGTYDDEKGPAVEVVSMGMPLGRKKP